MQRRKPPHNKREGRDSAFNRLRREFLRTGSIERGLEAFARKTDTHSDSFEKSTYRLGQVWFWYFENDLTYEQTGKKVGLKRSAVKLRIRQLRKLDPNLRGKRIDRGPRSAWLDKEYADPKTGYPRTARQVIATWGPHHQYQTAPLRSCLDQHGIRYNPVSLRQYLHYQRAGKGMVLRS